jgi:hypothetical protein
MDRTTGDGGRSSTSCRKVTSVLADGSPCNFADVAQLAEHDHAMRNGGRGHEFETRHPLHFGCVHALRGRVTWC